MGVPKFYRWLSERYPCLSEVVKEYQIPEFDNLYLDMNGIIHVCSHPNDNDPHFRISEEKIFKDIFHYIEVLFRLIQPRDVFFMAIDGVAPRAKMNQQRSRRFRSAREAIEAEKKAEERGEQLPKEARFDSNCITPGTEFMDRLDKQLQYFVTTKISQDKLWQRCKVIYSGHQTPGEGEHKIMEFIRHSKSQKEYNPNTRHCLYGLDADLMMLGITSHEPHFSLLREEVRFGGKKDNKRTPTPEETTFHLLHLSLLREYINYEFSALHESLPFPYDLECILDDWVLMGFLVGNDFIPHLPNLHINKEALPILFSTYVSVLPTLDGYLNMGGKLHLGRFEKFMAKLAEFDTEQFHEHNADLKYMQGKSLPDGEAFKANKGARELQPFDFGDGGGNEDNDLFGALEDDEVSATLARLGVSEDAMFVEDDDDDEEEDIGDMEFRQHKRNYYMTKMQLQRVNAETLASQAAHYVRGIQWILNYYYNGICSWSWYYPFHYSPFISDVKNFAHLELKFDMGKPFLPYEQLLAVLPPLSKDLLSKAYTELMTSGNSPLKSFYPMDFSTDLNGKQQEWEAVVLIPFIDEKLLLEAMKPCNENLTQYEKERNSHGPMYIYSYTPDNLGEYKAPKYFPSLGMNHAKMQLVWREEWDMKPEAIYKGLCKGVRQDLYFAGFPTLKHVPHKFHVAKENVKVFQQNSRGENFILDIDEIVDQDLHDLANQLLQKEIFVGWPHLIEAKVESVSDGKVRYSISNGHVQKHPLEGRQREEFAITRNHISTHYHDRWGVDVGETDILVYAAPMTGRRYVAGSDGLMTLEKEWSKVIQGYALQAIVKDIRRHDPTHKLHLTPQEYFPPRTKIFMLGQPHYGCIGEVLEIDPTHKGRIRVAMTVPSEPSFDAVIERQSHLEERYMPAYHASQKVGISSHLLARLTGTVFLAPPTTNALQDPREIKNKLNIGLNLKNNKRQEEVNGYSRKAKDPSMSGSGQWLYSEKAVEAILDYQKSFPEIFDHIVKRLGECDIFFQDEVFGNEKYKERVAQLSDWLKNADFAKAERQPCGTVTLGEEVVKRLVEEVDKVSAVRAKAVKMQVRPHLLFKPNPLQGSTPPDHTVVFRLFDRVINIREGFSVPLGARGTVIGIQPADKQADVLYDVLFDAEFPGGLTLRGTVSANRCYRLHWASIINLSHASRSQSSNTSTTTSRFPVPQQHHQPHSRLYSQATQNQQPNRIGGNQNNQFTSPVRWPAKDQPEKGVMTLLSNNHSPASQLHSNTHQPNVFQHNIPKQHSNTHQPNVLIHNTTQNIRPLMDTTQSVRPRLNALQSTLSNTNPPQFTTPQPQQNNMTQIRLVYPPQPNTIQPNQSVPQPQAMQSVRINDQRGAVNPGGQNTTQSAENTTSPQPPDPHQLPSPSALRPTGNCTNGDAPQNKVSHSPRSHQDTLVMLKSPDEVEVVVHGTFYSGWSRIKEQGLRRGNQRSLIPCYPFVPAYQSGPRAYQLLIFINVRAAMADGMQFFRVGEKQILCSGDQRGVLPPHYFSKVVDVANCAIIYPRHQNHPGQPLAHPNQQMMGPGGQMMGPGGQMMGPGGRGRGRGGAVGVQQPQGLQLYQDIWSQVQRIDSDHYDGTPAQNNAMPQMLNMPSANPSSAPPASHQAQTREISVQDIFQAATHSQQQQQQPHPSTSASQATGSNDILSMLSAAQQSFSLNQQAAAQSYSRNHSSTSANNSSQKSSSPTKSAFVPTQVIRKQTPRKPKAHTSDSSTTNTNAQGSPAKSHSPGNQRNHHQHQHHQQQQPNIQENQNAQQKQETNKSNGESTKPKRQVRSRLAVKFDQMPNKE